MSIKRIDIAKDLGIQLSSKKEEELFKWFLACLLYGKPIQQQVAERAFLKLAAAGLLSPDAILRAGWDELIRLLDEARYVRFDFSTATKLLHISKELKERYGSLTNLLAESKTPAELSKKLQEFKYIGPTTARIFLREVRPLWYPSSADAAAKQRRSLARPVPTLRSLRAGSEGRRYWQSPRPRLDTWAGRAESRYEESPYSARIGA